MEANEWKDLKELIEFLKANEIAEFDLEQDELKVRLKFKGAPAEHGAGGSMSAADMLQMARMFSQQNFSQPSQGQPAPMAEVAHAHAVGAAVAEAAPEAAKHHVVKSPIVGTFYEAPAPGSPPFVKVGDVVEVGQVLCIVEAMKLMNEIESDMAGEVMERIAAAGQPVEYGQPLFAIKAR